MHSPSVIVQVAAEGGGVTLIGRRTEAGVWKFKRTSLDHTNQLLDESEPPLRGESEWVSSWDEAVRLLDKYPWASLYPRTVHPEFADRILVEATRRLLAKHDRYAAKALDRWAAICGMPAPNE